MHREAQIKDFGSEAPHGATPRGLSNKQQEHSSEDFEHRLNLMLNLTAVGERTSMPAWPEQ